MRKQSKAFLAGEPVPSFVKRGAGAIGCWVCGSAKDSHVVQRNIKSAICRSKNPALRIECFTMSSIEDRPGFTPEVRYTVVCRLYENPETYQP